MSDRTEFPSWYLVEYRMEKHRDGGDGVECGESPDCGESPSSGGVDEGKGKQRLANTVVQYLEHQHGNMEPAQCMLLAQIPETEGKNVEIVC